MITRYTLAMVLVVGPVLAAPCWAAEGDVLKAIPANAWGFLLVNRLDTAGDKLAKVAQLAQVPLPPVPLLNLLKMQMGVQGGVDDSGSAAVAVMPATKDGQQDIVFVLVPVTDYKEFVTQLGAEDPNAPFAKVKIFGDNALAAQKGQFAVLCQEDGDDKPLREFINARTTVAAAIKPLLKRLLACDVAVGMTPDGVARFFDVVEFGFNQAKGAAAMAGPQAESLSAISDLAKETFQQFRREVSHFGAGLRIDEYGDIDLATWSIFVPAGEFTKAARDATAPEVNVLSGLPDGPFVFAGGGVVPPSWSKILGQFTVKMLKANPVFSEMTDEQTAQMAELMAKSSQGMDVMALTMGTTKPGESTYTNTMAVIRVADSQAYLANQKKSMELMAQLPGGSKLYELKELKIGGFSAIEITSDMAAIAKANGQEDAAVKKSLEKMVGPDGKLKSYVAAIDPKTVGFTYVKPENIERLAAAIKNKQSSLTENANFAKTVGLLPAGGQWAACISPTGFVELMKAGMEQAGPGVPFKLPEFAQTPPIGATAKMLSVGLETHLVVPAEVLTAGGKFVQDFQKAIGAVMQMQMKIQPGGAPPQQPGK